MTPRSAENIVAFGPSLVDIHARLEDEVYQECLSKLNARPGDWIPLETAQDADRVASYATRHATSVSNIITSPPTPGISIEAGSSLLNMLGSMPREFREQSSLITARAVQDDTPDPLALFFSESVEKLSIRHRGISAEGHNPVGFVLSSPGIPEKTMAAYHGAASDIAPYNLDLSHTDLVMIDAYELRRGKLATYLDQLISSGETSIAMSLGNHTILTGSLRTKIRTYIRNNKIAMLCGNQAEYQQLFFECSPELTTREGFRSHPVRSLVQYALITHGSHGISASVNGEFASADAVPVDEEKIINTAGAGDVATGIFCSGILRGEKSQEVLTRAAYFAAQALQVKSGLVSLDSETSHV